MFSLFTFMLAYRVYRSSSLKARLLSEQLVGMRVKFKRAALLQSYGKLFSIRFCCRMWSRKTNGGSWSRSASRNWILLLFGLLFCFTPSLLSVLLYRNHCRYAFVGTLIDDLYKKPTVRAIITCVCTVPWTDINWSLARYCHRKRLYSYCMTSWAGSQRVV